MVSQGARENLWGLVHIWMVKTMVSLLFFLLGGEFGDQPSDCNRQHVCFKHFQTTGPRLSCNSTHQLTPQELATGVLSAWSIPMPCEEKDVAIMGLSANNANTSKFIDRHRHRHPYISLPFEGCFFYIPFSDSHMGDVRLVSHLRLSLVTLSTPATVSTLGNGDGDQGLSNWNGLAYLTHLSSVHYQCEGKLRLPQGVFGWNTEKPQLCGSLLFG